MAASFFSRKTLRAIEKKLDGVRECDEFNWQQEAEAVSGMTAIVLMAINAVEKHSKRNEPLSWELQLLAAHLLRFADSRFQMKEVRRKSKRKVAT